MLFEEEVIVNQRTIFGNQRGKWITLAALAAILVALLAVGVVRAQDAMMSERDYAENGTDPVVTLTAADPEKQMVYWSLYTGTTVILGVVETDYAAASHFMVTPSADGASASLSFKFPPDYETPMGAVVGDDTTNTYKVVVVAADDAPRAVVAGDLLDDSKKTYHKITVVVTDEDEDGSISLSALQPQAGVLLTATLMDDDVDDVDDAAADIEFKWEQASAMSGPWTLISGATTAGAITAGAITASYMPAADVVGIYLRATAIYDDRHGDDKTAMAVSANAVRAEPSGTNSVPTFPVGADDNDRDVDENSPPGTNVGDPVKASDSPGEVLTYTLTGTNEELYSIDRATGQISVGARTMLDREGLNSPPQHTVTVAATDPYGPSVSPVSPVLQEVRITINDVNEAPTVSGGPTRIKHQEGSDPIDLDSEATGTQAPIYAATDAEAEGEGACTDQSTGSTCAWSLEGPDAADFTIDNDTDATFGLFAFKNAPDFENPADADMDNVYEVTVKVTDSGVDKMSATRDVMITVTNDNEDGEVTFSSVQPKVGRPITATLNDPDGMTTGVTWQWWRTMSETADAAPSFSNDADWEKIAGAKSDTYKPVSGDVSRWLTAMAIYTDPDGSSVAMDNTPANAVVANTDNVAPEFREGGDFARDAGHQGHRRELRIGYHWGSEPLVTWESSVLATDPNNIGDVVSDLLTYTLGRTRQGLLRNRSLIWPDHRGS